MTRRRRAAPGAPEGGLVVDKPAGMTSHDVVALARRVLGQPRIGHTGTLDPMATGVLVLLLGRATRLAQYLATDEKTYLATIRFGWATSTYDAEGVPVPGTAKGPRAVPGTTSVGTDALEAALECFRGPHLQVPPQVSAKKVAGRRAYELAREDKPVPLAPVQVQTSELTIVRAQGDAAEVRVTCSAGFYVRSLAHDVGVRLGTGAHLASLRRIRSGRFSIAEAVTAESLAADPETTCGRLVPMSELLPGMPVARLTSEGCRRIAHGQTVGPSDLESPLLLPGPASRVQLVDEAGGLVAVAEVETTDRGGPSRLLHPVLVLM